MTFSQDKNYLTEAYDAAALEGCSASIQLGLANGGHTQFPFQPIGENDTICQFDTR